MKAQVEEKTEVAEEREENVVDPATYSCQVILGMYICY